MQGEDLEPCVEPTRYLTEQTRYLAKIQYVGEGIDKSMGLFMKVKPSGAGR